MVLLTLSASTVSKAASHCFGTILQAMFNSAQARQAINNTHQHIRKHDRQRQFTHSAQPQSTASNISVIFQRSRIPVESVELFSSVNTMHYEIGQPAKYRDQPQQAKTE